MSENKFLIKTTILETIENLEQLSPNDFDLADDVLKDIRQITDKNSLFKLIMNEFFKENNEYRLNIIAYILTSIFEREFLKESLWAVLKSRNYNDEIQNKILFLIKSLGEFVNYEEYIKYFDDPDKVIDKDTEKLLDSATCNPESQIDFVDFITTLNESDWELMLTSLNEDFKGDVLANILVPLVYMNLQNENRLNFIIDVLSKTSSSLALKPFEDVVKYSMSQSCVRNAKKEINMLKLKGKKDTHAIDFYKKIIENSTFNEAYVSYPDGHGNKCLLVSRKALNGTVQYFSAVIRDLKEIVDCFGFFELSEQEYNKIIKRFVEAQRLIKIHENIALSFLNSAEIYSLENNLKIPYEYFCWKNLLIDSDAPINIEAKLQESVNPNYARFEFNEASFDVFETWFFDENDDFFKKSLDVLLPSMQIATTIENFLGLLRKNYLQFEVDKKIRYRLSVLAMLMSLCGNKNLISVVAAINNPASYEQLEVFMLKHSIYEYFLREQENYTPVAVTNIFNKKSDVPKHKFTEAQVLEAINYIEGNW